LDDISLISVSLVLRFCSD